MATYAIGDVHGCFLALKHLIDQIRLETNDTIVFLGDYVDRGINSNGVINFLLNLNSSYHCVFLMGNHDEMMLKAREDLDALSKWMTFGGDSTLISYSPGDKNCDLKNIPDSHWEFLGDLKPYFETDSEIFVHGSVDSEKPMDAQDHLNNRWLKLGEPSPHFSGKRVIVGHTSQRSGRPLDLGHTVCIDTYPYGDGWLSALDVEQNIVHQTMENGDSRQIDLKHS